jgi:PadR family transcriptional regulator, regulatory protein PadR
MTGTFDSQTFGRRINELLLLHELDRGPLHGYQVVLEIEERSRGYFQFNHGTLYPILHRLEKEGLVAGRWSDPARGRPRKEYALTEAGRTYLAGLRVEWRELRTRLESWLDGEEGEDGAVRTGAA